jgi:HPt (histidine-containing phosphotransfer) domain-containing protein
MKSTEYRARAEMPETMRDRFELLRAAYHKRLSSDRTQLMHLRARLALRDPDPRALLDTIRRVAHGMAGAGAVFEAHDVAYAARLLESAATEALRRVGTDTVRSPLNALIALLEDAYSGEHRREPF